MSNGAEIGLKLLFGHADSGVGDRQDMLFIITVNSNLKRYMGIKFRFLHQAQMPVFFQGISCVRNQFTHKDIPLGIEGVDHNIKNLSCFRLKLFCFNLCFGHVVLPLFLWLDIQIFTI